jgi:hypothetical protein
MVTAEVSAMTGIGFEFNSKARNIANNAEMTRELAIEILGRRQNENHDRNPIQNIEIDQQGTATQSRLYDALYPKRPHP